MDERYSLDALRGFLDWAASKGALKRATALSWRTAVDKVFADPDGIDTRDLRDLKQNLEVVLDRFANLHGKEYTQASLRTYQGRVRSAISEFLRYVDDPVSYSPRVSQRTTRANARSPEKPVGVQPAEVQKPGSDAAAPLESGAAGGQPLAGLTVPVPIRENVLVRIHGIPADLTSAEAEKIANVVKAYATVDKK